MANAFFNDTLPPFEGIDIGWDQDPNFPIGDYEVVQDAADATNRQFTLSQTEDDNVALSEGVLMITGPATSGLTAASEGGLDLFPPDFEVNEESGFAGRAAWYQIGEEFAKLDGDDNPLLAQDIDGNELTIQNGEKYGFWITFESSSANPERAEPYSGVGRLVIEEISTTIRFIGSSTHKESTDAFKLVAELGRVQAATYPVIFLGSAEVELIDGETTATFTQYTFGPLTLPTISYLDDLVSGDDKTLLMVGEDRGITTSPIAAEEGNDIYETDTGQVKLRIGVVADGNIVIVREEEGGITVPKIGVEDGAFAEDDHAH